MVPSPGALHVLAFSDRGRAYALVVAGKEVRSRAADRINIGVRFECNIVRNEEDSVAATNDRLLVKLISKSQPGHELLFRKRQVVAGVVDARLYQEQIAQARAARHTAAAGNRRVCGRRIKIGHLVEALRPRSLQFVAEPEVNRQLTGDMPVVAEIQGPVGLLA